MIPFVMGELSGFSWGGLVTASVYRKDNYLRANTSWTKDLFTYLLSLIGARCSSSWSFDIQFTHYSWVVLNNGILRVVFSFRRKIKRDLLRA